MPSIHDSFPTKYLSAKDLKGRTFTLAMDKLVFEDIGDDGDKPVLYFKKAEKGLVLNKTNAGEISDVFGDDYTLWGGGTLTLYPDRTSYQGKMVDCIRVAAKPEHLPASLRGSITQNAQAPLNQPAPIEHDEYKDLNDAIPF